MRQAEQPLSTARVQAPEEPVPGTRRLSGLSWLRSLVAMHDREPAVKAGDTSRSARTFNVRPIASADTPAHVDTGAPGANRPDVSFQAPGTSGMSRPSRVRSEEHTSELQSLMRISYAAFCLKKQKQQIKRNI